MPCGSGFDVVGGARSSGRGRQAARSGDPDSSPGADDPKRIGPAALEVMGNAVLGHGSGMSESLQRRYLERLWAEHTAFARWKQRILAGSLAAVVLVASLMFVAIRRHTPRTTRSRPPPS